MSPRRHLLLGLALTLGLGSGCTYAYNWKTVAQTLPPAANENCIFEISEELPEDRGPWIQLAEFAAVRRPSKAPTTEHKLRKSISEEVCKLGGTMVLIKPNPTGRFTRGKIYHRPDV